jgi:quinoprotein glucose dehydrogenase
MNLDRIHLAMVTNRMARLMAVGLASAGAWMMQFGATQTADAAAPVQHHNWYEYGGGPDQSKYSDLTQITKANVDQLQPAWIYSPGDAGGNFNPIVVDDVMYVVAKGQSLIALDATTGKELWIHAHLTGINTRGINYWESKDRKDRRLLIVLNNTLQAIDATTGKSILNFGKNGYTSILEGMPGDPVVLGRQATTPGAIWDNLIFLGSSPGEGRFSAAGHLRAYDVVTGKLMWVFHTVPLPGEFGYDTWPKDAYKWIGGVNTWGEISVDDKRGIVYFPLGSPTYDYYGADRVGQGLFGDCLLALDARTGKRLWHFQGVHHDMWDFDFTAAPQLITVQHEGKAVDAIAQAGKQGFLYVLNRVTGVPLWPIEERPVPQSEVPQEQTWPTQPFPTVVPPFTRQKVTTNDINPYWSEAKRETFIKRVAAANSGLFQPLSTNKETITMPGATGGANFGNTAADPGKGLVFVAAQEYASVYSALHPPGAGGRRGGGGGQFANANTISNQLERAKVTYTASCQPCHGTERQGMANFPAITNIAPKYTFEAFKNLVTTGKGQMPAAPHFEDATLMDLYVLCGGIDPALVGRGGQANGRRGNRGGGDLAPIEGPVVESGGAPAAAEASGRGGRGGGRGGRGAYPDDFVPPTIQYEISGGYGLEYSDLLSPPWSTITAYDLNKGTIKWTRPLGQDQRIVQTQLFKDLGGKETGIPIGTPHKGMIVTATGIVFATCKDGYLYAYDEDNGNMLWKYRMPGGAEGLMCMYESKGRQYLAFFNTRGGGGGRGGGQNASPVQTPAFVALALPEKK